MKRCLSKVSLRSLLIVGAIVGITAVNQNVYTMTLTEAGVAVLEDFDSMTGQYAVLPDGFRYSPNNFNLQYNLGLTTTSNWGGTEPGSTNTLTATSTGGYWHWLEGDRTTATDSCMGILLSSGFTGPRSIYLRITNNTGVEIETLEVDWDFEKYRSGSRESVFSFFTSTNGTSWTAFTAGNHTFPADPTTTVAYHPPLTTPKSVTITGLSIPPEGVFYLRWSLAGTGGHTNVQGLGIDNMSITGLALDTTPPQISAITRADSNPTNAASVSFDVIFTEDVTGVSASNFSTTTTGTLADTAITGVVGSGSTYVVTVATGTGDGDLGIEISDATGIEDVAENLLDPSFLGGDVYTIDRTPPAVPNVTLASASDSGIDDSDGITNISNLSIIITTDPLTEVTLLRDGGNAITETTDGAGVATISSGVLGDGSYSFTATAKDDLENTSVESAPLAVQIDTVVPSATAMAPLTKVTGDIAITTDSDAMGGSAVSSVAIYVAVPGSSIYTLAETPYTPAAGSGIYSFRAVARDVAGNSGTIPVDTSSDLPQASTIYNAVENEALALPVAAGVTGMFPMTDDLIVTVDFTDVTEVNGPVTVSRLVGDIAPNGYDAAKLIDEALVITADFTGQAKLVWQAAPESFDNLIGIADTAFRVPGVGAPELLPIADLTGSTISIEGIAAFSTWYVGDSSAADSKASDWMILAD